MNQRDTPTSQTQHKLSDLDQTESGLFHPEKDDYESVELHVLSQAAVI